jgi:hypothetical protein
MNLPEFGSTALFEPVAVIRTITAGRPALGRWEVHDAAGNVVGVVAEERPRGAERSTFTVVHNPTGVPFRPPPGRRLRALGAWSSAGHPSVPAAVAALVGHLKTERPAER